MKYSKLILKDDRKYSNLNHFLSYLHLLKYEELDDTFPKSTLMVSCTDYSDLVFTLSVCGHKLERGHSSITAEIPML